MRFKVLGFVLKGLLYSRLVVNLLLRTTFDSEIAELQRVDFTLEEVESVGAFVHEINFRNDTNCPIARRVNFSRHLQSIRVGQVSVGGSQGKDESVFGSDILDGQVPDLLFNVLWLPLNRHLGQAGQINQRQIYQVLRINRQSDRSLRNSLRASRHLLRLSCDFSPDILKIIEAIVWSVEELGVLPLLLNFILLIRPLQSSQLQNERAPSYDSRSSRKEIAPNNTLQNGGLAGGLPAHDDKLWQLDRVRSAQHVEGVLQLHYQRY